MIGTTISHYRILEKLGEGGMGVVYLAEDTRLFRQVAVKFLPSRLSADDEDRQRLHVEARAAAALNHPNIATVHAIEEADDKIFIVMERVDGRTLDRFIRDEHPLPLDRVLAFAIQIADGLEAAHRSGIVHRDMKPSNVMVTSDGRIKVMDFGLARMDRGTRLTRQGTTLGTAAYMAPEMAMGRDVDRRADIWSVGVTLFEMITAELPFRGAHFQAVMYSILNEEPQPMSALRAGVPPELERIVTKALQKDPAHRFEQMGEMLAGMREVRDRLKGTSVSAVEKQGGGRDSLERALASLRGDVPAASTTGLGAYGPMHAVGRARERQRLDSLLEEAVTGHGRLVCLTGEAGIGKTTLLAGFIDQIRDHRAGVLLARGQSSERLAGTEGYQPIIDALKALVGGPSGEAIATLLRHVAPTWYVEAVPLSHDDETDARVIEDARVASAERKKRELGRFVEELVRARPLVLLFDDLHWADVSTVDLIGFLGSKCAQMALLMVVAYRPADLLLSGNRFEEVKRTLQAKRIALDLAVGFLRENDVAEYLDLEFDPNDFSADLAGVIHRQTEGNPLFMADLVRDLRDREVVAADGGIWVLQQRISLLTKDLPDSIRSMIERKLERLGPSDRLLLTIAAVEGQQFHSAVAARVLDADPAEIEERLDRLAEVHGMVRLMGESELPDQCPTLVCEFVHILYQNALFGALSPTRRASLALSVAETLLSSHEEDVDRIAARLAFLYETGRRYDIASDRYGQAAENALRSHATEEASELYSKAISCAERLRGPDKDRRLMQLNLHAGNAHAALGTVGEMERSFDCFDRSVEASIRLGDLSGQVSALCTKSYHLFILKQLEPSRRVAEYALDLAESAGLDVGIAHANALLATERFALGDIDAAERLYRQAVPVIRKEDESVQASLVAAWQGFIYAWRGEYEKHRELVEWALDRSRESGLPWYIAQNVFFLGVAAGNEGRLSDAFYLLREGLQLADQNTLRNFENRLPNCLGWLHSELQDTEAAEVLNRQSIQVLHEFDLEPEANARVNLAHDYIEVGELDRAFEELNIAEGLYDRDVWFRWRYRIRTQAELANYWIHRGDLALAGDHAQTALGFAEETTSRKYIAYSKRLLADIAALEDRVEDARELYASALRLLQQYACPFVEWKTWKAAAGLEKRLKNDTAADEYRGRAKAVVYRLAESLDETKLREGFLRSRAVRELG